MIVPFSAGGPTDTLGRIMAQRMSKTLAQTVIVENTTGAGGSIGVGRVARAAPDGYTVGIGHWSTHVVNGVIYDLPYDLIRDFEPVAMIASNPQIAVSKNAIGLPRAASKEIVAKLNAAIVESLADPALRQRYGDLGQEIPPRDQQTPEALAAYHKAEIAKWWPLIKAAGIKGE